MRVLVTNDPDLLAFQVWFTLAGFSGFNSRSKKTQTHPTLYIEIPDVSLRGEECLELLWMDEILHHLETMGNHGSSAFTGGENHSRVSERWCERISSMEPDRLGLRIFLIRAGMSNLPAILAARSFWAWAPFFH